VILDSSAIVAIATEEPGCLDLLAQLDRADTPAIGAPTLVEAALVLRSRLTMDPRVHTQRVTAKTTKGNILLNVSSRFGADIDATVLTTDEEAAGIRSDFTGLTVKRDQFNGKTRVHATGKIGGGGDKIELFAEDGEIQIGQLPVAR